MDTLEPLDELTDECIKYLNEIGSNSTKVSQIVNNQDPKVYTAIEKGNWISIQLYLFKKLFKFKE